MNRLFASSALLVVSCLASCFDPVEPPTIGEISDVRYALHEPCFSDDDCSGGGLCDTSECLSCCEPDAEVCIAVCCGSCEQAEPPGGRPCASILCAPGYEPVTDANGCDHACRPIRGRGVPCGDAFCAPGDVCCNESCGICTPPDGVCIQIICL